MSVLVLEGLRLGRQAGGLLHGFQGDLAEDGGVDRVPCLLLVLDQQLGGGDAEGMLDHQGLRELPTVIPEGHKAALRCPLGPRPRSAGLTRGSHAWYAAASRSCR